MTGTMLWMRSEARPDERRAPIVPADARRLVDHGIQVTVEESAHRVFPTEQYVAAGCRIAAPASWPNAPAEAFIVGLKELPADPERLIHRHVFFGHAYKGQAGARELLSRFTAGGALLDLEYLTDDAGRRLAAFGYWAGYVGAALAVLHHRGRLAAPLRPTSRDAMDAALRPDGGPNGLNGSNGSNGCSGYDNHNGGGTRALVIGALGRCGRGARDALATAGIAATCWDVAETERLDRAALLGHDVLVNAVLAVDPIPPFVTPADLDDPTRRLSVICDVTCDVTSACNALPIYEDTTDWTRPARRLREHRVPVDVIAIDNLPSLFPGEASTAFSADLLPHLLTLDTAAPWRRCLERFAAARRAPDA